MGLKLTNVAETDANNVFGTSLALFDNLVQGGSNGYTASFLATSRPSSCCGDSMSVTARSEGGIARNA